MSISRKCLNTDCNEYEHASKKDFKTCTDCAYLFKPSKIDFLKLIGKVCLLVMLISALAITVFIASKSLLQNQNDNQNNNKSSFAPPTEIIKPTAQENKTVTDNPVSTIKTVLKIHGSNTIGSDLMPKLVEGYLKKNGAVEIKEISGTRPQEKRIEFKLSTQDEEKYDVEIYSAGSDSAFKDLESGLCDIGMSSRKVTENEVNLLNTAGVGILSTLRSETIIALDGISVIVNKNNPINSLSIKQISDIFSGTITNWSQLGGKAGKIKVFSRNEASGTTDNFKNLVLGNKNLTKEAVFLDTQNTMSAEVSKEIDSIGFTSFSSVGNTKTLSISQGSVAPLYPDSFNIATEDYFLSERLYLYCPENRQNSYATELINYITDDEGQNIIKENNFSTINIEVDENFKPLTKPVFINQAAMNKYDTIISNTQARLSINFLFKNGSYELDSKSIKDLEKVINFLFRNKYIDSKILLVGYSDSSGDYNMNVKLSEQRALYVKGIILKEFGVLDGRVDTLGLGPEIPISSNDTVAGMAKNRRVEVYIMNK